MDFNCPQCGVLNQTPTKFCRNCGINFNFAQTSKVYQPIQQPPKIKNTPVIAAVLIGTVIILCAMSAAILTKSPSEISATNKNSIQSISALPTPAQNPSQVLADAKKALAENYNEKSKSYGRISVAKQLLQSITSNQKEYKEAQNLLGEVARREVLVDRLAGKIVRKSVVEQMERKMLSQGYDFKFITSGENDDILTIEYVLMSRPFVYKMSTETDLIENFKKAGFKKLTLTDGYNEKWNFDLTK